jgi:hypothetical protein
MPATLSPEVLRHVRRIEITARRLVDELAAAKAAGMKALLHKATQGKDWRDPKFASAMAAAQDLGLLRGAYHFASNSADGAVQADWFMERVALAVGTVANDVLLALDWENNPDTTSGVMSVENARRFVERVHTVTGRWPLVYSFTHFLNGVPDCRHKPPADTVARATRERHDGRAECRSFTNSCDTPCRSCASRGGCIERRGPRVLIPSDDECLYACPIRQRKRGRRIVSKRGSVSENTPRCHHHAKREERSVFLSARQEPDNRGGGFRNRIGDERSFIDDDRLCLDGGRGSTLRLRYDFLDGPFHDTVHRLRHCRRSLLHQRDGHDTGRDGCHETHKERQKYDLRLIEMLDVHAAMISHFHGTQDILYR